jgi:hypothetical protein
VDVYQLGQPNIVQSFDCCPILHGAAQIRNIGLFGCSDGVLLLKKQGDNFEAIKLNHPANTLSRTRVGLFATHPNSPFVLGNFGQGLALIDPEQATLRVLPLPAQPLKFSFDETGVTVVVLTHDGILHHLDLPTGGVIATQKAVTAVDPPTGPDGKARPTFTLGAEQVYLIEPSENQLKAVNLTTMQLGRVCKLSENT